MNILWFSLSPCGSIRRKKIIKYNQGWMISLEDEIKKRQEIKLSVAYYENTESEDFEYKGVHYYPISRPFSRTPIERRICRFISQKYLDNRIIPEFIKIIDKVKPDLIHIHGTEEAFGKIGEYIHNIPIVFSIQGLLAPYSYKFFSGIPQEIIRKYEPLKDKLIKYSYLNDYKVNCYRRERELRYLQNAKYILGRTFWDREITQAINPNRKYYVVNEILRSPFFNARWIKTQFSDKIIIVSTISIGIYKGYETLLEAANILKKYSNLNFEWQIIGYNKNHKCANIIHKMTRLNPDKCNIKFLGLKSAEEMADILTKADIYCHVSHIENSPNSVCEAMIIGLPIIATFAGGTASLIENEKEGKLIQDGDPFILAGAIYDYISNFKMAQTYGLNARKRALARHTPQSVGDELMNAYKEILKNEL